MNRLDIKPLSVNKVWQGRRFKSKDYKRYEQEAIALLPDKKIPDGRLRTELIFGIRKVADIDNPLKPILDIFQARYNFNDNRIFELNIKKVINNTGFIEWDIFSI